MFAHLGLHEFAHVVQAITGRRRIGSVHDDGFYEILDKAHENGHGKLIADSLRHSADKAGINVDALESWWINSLNNLQQHLNKDWAIGDNVAVVDRDGKVLLKGKITQRLRKRYVISVNGNLYRAHHISLRHLESAP